MYACMHVFMYACMHVCIYDHICLSLCPFVGRSVFLSVCRSVCLDAGRYVPEKGDTKGRRSKRGNKACLCKNWLYVNACCVHKFLCAVCVCVKTSVCKNVCM